MNSAQGTGQYKGLIWWSEMLFYEYKACVFLGQPSIRNCCSQGHDSWREPIPLDCELSLKETF